MRPHARARCAAPFLALAALLAALLLACVSPSAAYSDDLYRGYYKNGTTASKQAFAAAKAALQGLHLRCAIYTILQNNTYFPDSVTYGDGYAYLTGFSKNPLVKALQDGDPNNASVFAGPNNGRGFAVPAAYADVDGSSVWILKWHVASPEPRRFAIAQQSGANITFDVVRLPAEIYYSSPLNMNTNDTAARVIYLLEELGYDCVAGAVFVWPARMQFFRYLLPHQPYGFQVVTTAPTWTREGLFSRLFKFARPFDWRMWLLMAGSIFVSGLVITYYERNTGGDDFPIETESVRDKLTRGMFLSAMGITLLAFFSPRTHEGRLYTAFKAFVIFVLMSSYIAQYSAIQNSLPQPVQPVSGIQSFGALGKPVCMRQIASQNNWLKTTYPQLNVKPIPGLTQAGLLRAIVNGECVGGVGPDVELRFGMGGPGLFDEDGFDPQKTYCKLTTVGETLNFGFYGIPFKKNDTAKVNPATLDAMNVFVNDAIESGAYGNAAKIYFPEADSRSACTSTAAALEAEVLRIKSGQLELSDMGGLFVVQAAGVLLSLLVHVARSRAFKRGIAAMQPAQTVRLAPPPSDALFVKMRQRDREECGSSSEEEYSADGGEGDADDGLATHLLVASQEYPHGGSEGRLAKLLLQNTAEIDELRRTLHAFTAHIAHEHHMLHRAVRPGEERPGHTSVLRPYAEAPAEEAPPYGGRPVDTAALSQSRSLHLHGGGAQSVRLRATPTRPLRLRPAEAAALVLPELPLPRDLPVPVT